MEKVGVAGSDKVRRSQLMFTWSYVVQMETKGESCDMLHWFGTLPVYIDFKNRVLFKSFHIILQISSSNFLQILVLSRI